MNLSLFINIISPIISLIGVALNVWLPIHNRKQSDLWSIPDSYEWGSNVPMNFALQTGFEAAPPLAVTNCGDGNAYNVRLEKGTSPLFIINGDTYNYKLMFSEVIPVIRPGETVHVISGRKMNGCGTTEVKNVKITWVDAPTRISKRRSKDIGSNTNCWGIEVDQDILHALIKRHNEMNNDFTCDLTPLVNEQNDNQE